jgi:hypothetical protein
MQDIDYIIQKYEVPKEYIDALCDAYEAGAKRGFIDGSIAQFNKNLALEVEE